MLLLWLSIGWVFASVLVAMLPMRRQYVPGVLLLLAAPMLIYVIAVEVALWAGFAAMAAFLSMYRNPLKFFWKKVTGWPVNLRR
ncbi:Protein of unknown function [Marivita hallyeonensis]|uniref:UDP-N-acetylmuramate--alanine ligase n=2 Tax=Marivita hallyeonensis TaxID=996342 RepID=A0A1M5WAD1_9RHOB|nr:Protein of unknown function [Marivita hallyeonensis]